MGAPASDGTLLEIFRVATAISEAGDLRALLNRILSAARALTLADAGSVFLLERAAQPPFWKATASAANEAAPDRLWFAVSQNDSLEDRHRQVAGIDAEVHDIRLPINADRLVGWCVLSGEVLNIPDAYRLDPALPYRFDPSLDQQLGYRTASVLTVPLRTSAGDIVGVLQLINRKREPDVRLSHDNAHEETQPFSSFDQDLILALASLAAVCVQRTQLLEGQEALIESIITLLAGAIDAKSPYTGGHCDRVPQLAVMLAEAAEAASEGPLAEFRFGSAEAWREFRTGAWLHDCGKVTTPEHVVDKATKLEGKFDRIHEVRTRFEVLLRDARIERLEALLAGGDRILLDRRLRERELELQNQFACIARSNIGGEYLRDDELERLRQIGAQIWMRHFDDSLGLSWEEQQRRSSHPPVSSDLPAIETLLADQPWHRSSRRQETLPDPAMGFQLSVPADVFNYGELHNLAVSRGTLTEEERFQVNDHIVQTIIMLERLPFPPNLARVPEYAGTHHETLQGDGYPRRLGAERLSIPARIMAIADIFEALTAADRPYKRGKTLSEALAILAGFRDRGHIDSDLFELLLSSGVYRRYADQFMLPGQIDEVDIHRYLQPRPME